jgi:uncharacterized membrane protein (UPF0127 family)
MRRVFATLVCIGACQGAASEKTVSDLPRGAVRFDTAQAPWMVAVEIAADDASRTRGLMFRTSLAKDHGMLFVFPDTDQRSFWMHNTLIPLDMIFLDETRTVVGVVANAAPQTDTPRGVAKPSRYVVEVGGGEAAAHGVGPGIRAAFTGVSE